MNIRKDKSHKKEYSLVSRISRIYSIGMILLNGLLLISFCYINLSYLYTDELVDMANRVTVQFEDTTRNLTMEKYFNESQTVHFLQQLNDLNKYSRPEKVHIYVVFPNGVTSQYSEKLEQVVFELLPPDFFYVFREAIKNDELTTEWPGVRNHFSRWNVAVPIRGYTGNSGGIVITSIYTKDVITRLFPVFLTIGLSLILSFAFLINAQKGFSQILASPLNNITSALEAWSLSRFSGSDVANRTDEIGRLARTLDEVADKLEEEQQRRDRDDENRRNFFNNVSHELKTPVAALRAQTELLKDGLATKEELPGYYDSILRETLYIQHMVDDLLTLSRLQAPGYKMEKEPCCLTDILNDVYQSLSPAADGKGIELRLDRTLAPEYTVVNGNYTRIRQLIIIFTENAIKYSERGAHVWIQLTEKEKALELVVQDEGCGIPKTEVDQVFQHQFRASNTGNKSGNGLGLAIANEIASLMHFTLSLESEEYKGTTVTVHIPYEERLL